MKEISKKYAKDNHGDVGAAWPKGKIWDAAKQERNWLLCHLEPRAKSPEKLDKIPLDPQRLTPIGAKKAAKLSFDEALRIADDHNARQGLELKSPGGFGIGYLPRRSSVMIGIDIDDAFVGDDLREDFAQLVSDGETYIELSPSGAGLRALVPRQGDDETVTTGERNGVGLFATEKKFFTVTGNYYSGSREIRKAPGLRKRVRERYGQAEPLATLPASGASTSSGALQGTSGHPWGAILQESREAALRAALEHIPHPGSDEGWVKITMGCKSAGVEIGEDVAREIWDEWCHSIGGDMSQNDKRWESINNRPSGVSVATVFDAARKHGFSTAPHAFAELTDAEVAALTPASAPLPIPDFFKASNFYGKPVPVRQWLVEEKIPMADVTLLYGDGGTGKSLLALQLAFSVAIGNDWLGLPTRNDRAMYLTAEDDTSELHRRLDGIAKAKFTDLDSLDQLVLASLAGEDALLGEANVAGRIQPTKLYRAIRRRVRDEQPSLLVLDTLNDLFGGDENDKGQARQFISLLRGIALEHGCAVLLLAHPSKSGMTTGTGDSGSVAWSNSARSRLYLERSDNNRDERTLSTKKSNYGPQGEELQIKWRKGIFVRPSGVANLGEDRATRARRVFLKLLERRNLRGAPVNHNSGSNYAPSVFASDPDSEGLTKKDFINAMRRLLSEGQIEIKRSGPPSKPRQWLVCVSSPPGTEECSEAAEDQLAS